MTARGRFAQDATLPPAGLPGLDPAWSRLVDAPTSDGSVRTWHLLDTAVLLDRMGERPVGTVLAVHGNPTWSYLWRGLLAQSLSAPTGAMWRVIAVDQLEMGFSERTGVTRTVADRVRDLGLLTDALQLDGSVVTVGHDWGGVVSLGWAIDHPELLAGVVAMNTTVHQGPDEPLPPALRLALAAPVTRLGTSGTSLFLDATLAIAHPPLAAGVREAFRAPYRSAPRRAGIEAFVRDIPTRAGQPSTAELQRIGAGVARLAVPALILWGPRDVVFQERYLADLMRRLPHAGVHRFEGAGHLVPEDADVAGTVLTWLGATFVAPDPAASGPSTGWTAFDLPFEPLWGEIEARREERSVALTEMLPSGPRHVSWRELNERVQQLAAGFVVAGMRAGQRVSLLVPPGADLTATLYACLRIGAIVVVADAGLGATGLTRAVRGARPDWIVGVRAGLVAARFFGWPGVRIASESLAPALRRLLGVRHSLREVARLGEHGTVPTPPGPDDLAAVLFTSGSTGPAKGVRYTHRQLGGVRDALRAQHGLGRETGLVAGFAPFALLGPAFGCRTATPLMDVTRPATLTADRLAAAIEAVDADAVFLSPAAMTNVVATAQGRRDCFDRIRVVLSAGAPLGEPLLARASAIFPAASLHTPYGMTECLLVADITLDGIRAAGSGDGVCVGRPAGAARVLIAPLDAAGRPALVGQNVAGVTGEILIRAPLMLAGYDRLWLTDRAARAESPEGRWHRTGDVGHLDHDGRLWIEGRLPHIITAATGVLTPVGVEQRAEAAGVSRAAAVGVGPRGTQQLVVIAEEQEPGLVVGPLAAAVRNAIDVPVAAVLGVRRLPTDIRHNSKIDRPRLARWATAVLAGGRVPRP
ncbi:alpha/beta fold hydrolase [uncultured Amnibacterium sp.]|uniref:alpha/beta fold hydrolase n=1 Tax=uncultured Amnibacterium sp. TaxID=1631851 RepID=UPI0035CBCDAC